MKKKAQESPYFTSGKSELNLSRIRSFDHGTDRQFKLITSPFFVPDAVALQSQDHGENIRKWLKDKKCKSTAQKQKQRHDTEAISRDSR